MTPLPAPQALDAYYLEARSRLLDVAAILDRIGRGADPAAAAADPRAARIRDALDALRSGQAGLAERVQRIFSLDYDPAWARPTPRG